VRKIVTNAGGDVGRALDFIDRNVRGAPNDDSGIKELSQLALVERNGALIRSRQLVEQMNELADGFVGHRITIREARLVING